MHPTLEITDHHFKSTNMKLKLEGTIQQVEFFRTTNKISHHATSNGQLTSNKTLPACCKKKDGAQNPTFSLVPQERIQTPWYHPVSAFTVSVVIIFQSTKSQ